MRDLLLLLLSTGCLASAQEIQGSPAAAAAPAGALWSRVEALPPGTALHLNGQPHTSCRLRRADPESITCAKGHSDVTYPRAGIRSVKLAHRTRSTVVGLGIGAGVGAITGFAIGTNGGDSFFGKNAFRGGITAAFAGIGAVGGVPVGYFSDFTAGSAIYKAP